jgi:hypothetical protein
MTFEQVELHGASIITKADIGKGRSSVTVGLDAPLTSEAARALGCQESYLRVTAKYGRTCFFAHRYFICPPKR